MTWYRSILKALSRESISVNFIPEIDGLRFVAIITVVFFHTNEHIKRKLPALYPELVGASAARLFNHGYVGVELFFVISGFIISYPFARRYLLGGPQIRLKSYFLRRVTRLEPPYFINVLFMAGLLVLARHVPLSEIAGNVCATLSYMHSAIYGVTSAVNYVTWSLEIELQFYLLAPLLCSVLFRTRAHTPRLTKMVLAVVLATALSWAVRDVPRLHLSLLGYSQYFLTGFLMADLHLRNKLSGPPSRRYDLVSLSLWPALVYLVSRGGLPSLLLPCLVLLLYVAAFRGSLTNRFFRLPVVYTVGGMCYTMYLYHTVVIEAAVKALTLAGVMANCSVWLVYLTVSVAVIAFSAVCYLLFEKPFMLRDNRLVQFLARWTPTAEKRVVSLEGDR